MKISFFAIFILIGLIFLILSLIFKNKDKKMVKQCTLTTKGKVIKYTLWNNNGVHFPIVEYIVNGTKYNQRLKYGWIVNKSSSFNKIKTEVENDVKEGNLVINSNDEGKEHFLERVNSRNGMHTIEVAEKHGFGTTNYELIDIDE